MDYILHSYAQESEMELSEQQGMDAVGQISLLKVSRSGSSNLMVDPIASYLNFSHSADHPLIWQTNQHFQSEIPQIMESTDGQDNLQLPIETQQTSQNKKKARAKATNKSDYEKNICGYITRRVVREFLGKSYDKEILKLVGKHGSDLDECKAYYSKKMEFITGPSHLPPLFQHLPGELHSLASCKKVFQEFYGWFLKHRYLRYLLTEGKMSNKQAYIKYKNNHLFKYVQKQQNQPKASLQKQETPSFSEGKLSSKDQN